MLVEAVTLGAIFGGSTIAVLLVKNKFHAEIECSLVGLERESKQEEITPRSIHK